MAGHLIDPELSKKLRALKRLAKKISRKYPNNPEKGAEEFIKKLKDQGRIVYHHPGSSDIDYLESDGGIHFGTYDAALARIRARAIEHAEEALDIYKTDEGWNVEIDGVLYYEGLPTREEAERLGYELVKQTEIYPEIEEGEEIIRPAFLLIENPKKMPDQGRNWAKAIEQAKKEGYDSIIYENEYEDPGSLSYIVFSRKQIIPLDKLKSIYYQAIKEPS